VRAAPAVSCAMCITRMRTRAYRFSGNTPAFPAQWLYDLYVLSLVNRSLLPPSPPGGAGLPRTSRQQSGRQDHTTSPYASVPFVIGTSASTASRPAFRDDREPPLLVERDARIMPVIWVGVKFYSENRNRHFVVPASEPGPTTPRVVVRRKPRPQALYGSRLEGRDDKELSMTRRSNPVAHPPRLIHSGDPGEATSTTATFLPTTKLTGIPLPRIGRALIGR
jgi:hypothetical protein